MREDIFETLNELHPQCPVLLTEIKFKCASIETIYRNLIKKLDAKDELDSRIINRCKLTVENTNEAGESIAYVFPACGHVHGYHRSMEKKSCPMCRKVGVYVPLQIPICNQFDESIPTHVFNPCGHAASLETCIFWSTFPQLTIVANEFLQLSMCPFCSSKLIAEPAFSKLVLQADFQLEKYSKKSL